MKTKETSESYGCPRCGYPLTPVVARKGGRRTPIGYACPEPYCDYTQHQPAGRLTRLLAWRDTLMDRAS